MREASEEVREARKMREEARGRELSHRGSFLPENGSEDLSRVAAALKRQMPQLPQQHLQHRRGEHIRSKLRGGCTIGRSLWRAVQNALRGGDGGGSFRGDGGSGGRSGGCTVAATALIVGDVNRRCFCFCFDAFRRAHRCLQRIGLAKRLAHDVHSTVTV